jgi:hypothetical protein
LLSGDFLGLTLDRALFRQVNERIAETSATLDSSNGDVQPFICECSRIGCRQLVDSSGHALSQRCVRVGSFCSASGWFTRIT